MRSYIQRSPVEQSSVEPPFETDPTFIKGIWEDVRSYSTLTTDDMKSKTIPSSAAYTKGSASYNNSYLRPKKIRIFESLGITDKYLELDNTPTRGNLGSFYVDWTNTTFLKRLVSMVKTYKHRGENEAEWESKIYSKFLREDITPQEKTKPDILFKIQDLDFIDIGLQRKLKPIISLISRDGKNLLPPEQIDKQQRRQSANSFPPSIEDTEKEVPESRRSIIPDMIFAARAYPCSEDAFVTGGKFPAIRNLSDHDVYPPYLLVESKPTKDKETEAKQPTALLAAMLLLERLKLRVMLNNTKYDDLCIFILTCCGPRITIWKMSFDNIKKNPAGLIGYNMHPIRPYDITEESDLKGLCQKINNIHLFGLTSHKNSVLADLNACFDSEIQFDPEYIDLRALRLNKADAGTTARLEIGEEISELPETTLNMPGNPSGALLEPYSSNRQGSSNKRRKPSLSPLDDLPKRKRGRPRKEPQTDDVIADHREISLDIPGTSSGTPLKPRFLNRQGNSNRMQPLRRCKELKVRTS